MAGAFFDDQIMFILGITGGTATGKSSVVGWFAGNGAPAVSADAIARDLLSPGKDLTVEVLAAFPDCKAPDHAGLPAVDRKALGKLIFSDPQARIKLEAITHPPIVDSLSQHISDLRTAPGKVAVAEIPLLYELDLRSLVDAVLVVSCSRDTQIERLMARQHLTRSEAENWLAAQWPLQKKRARAEYVVNNNGPFSETADLLQPIWNSL